jgi:hypothetical protein
VAHLSGSLDASFGASDNGVSDCRCSEVAVLSPPADRGGQAARAAKAALPCNRRRRCGCGSGCGHGVRGPLTCSAGVSLIGPRMRRERWRGRHSLERHQVRSRPAGRNEDALSCIAAAGGSATDQGAGLHGASRTAVLRVPEAFRALCSASLLAGSFVGRGGGRLRKGSPTGRVAWWMRIEGRGRLRSRRHKRSERSGQRESGVHLASDPRPCRIARAEHDHSRSARGLDGNPCRCRQSSLDARRLDD